MAFRTVQLPADAGLSRLLRGGLPRTHFHRHFGAMANAASPGHAKRTVQVPVSLVPVIADGLVKLLRQARADADPAAGALAAFAAREFGVREEAAPPAVPQ
jgi:hypothetical protein